MSTIPTATALTDRGAAPWELAEERLRNPEKPRTSWLSTARPDGAPHTMPLITAWFDDALYFLTGRETRKGRNLADEPRCVISIASSTLPSLDLIIEGKAEPITDGDELRRATETFQSRLEWPGLEVRDGAVHGPSAPTAGLPPYAMYRLVPERIFGLPGMLGMERFAPEDLPRPTRWDFSR